MTDQKRVLQLLHQVSLPLERLLTKADQAAGCTAAQLSALAAVIYFGTSSLSALAIHEQVSQPTMSRIVHELVKLGLVTRRANEKDRRQSRLAVTVKGRTALEKACAVRVALLAEMFGDLNQEEWQALGVAVNVLTARLRNGSVALSV